MTLRDKIYTLLVKKREITLSLLLKHLGRNFCSLEIHEACEELLYMDLIRVVKEKRSLYAKRTTTYIRINDDRT